MSAVVSSEPLHQIARSLSLKDRDICEVGLIMKHALMESKMAIGEACRLLAHNHVGSILDNLDCDVLPLPVASPRVEERRILQALRAGAEPSHIFKDFTRSVRCAGRHAWLFLLVVLVNFMNLGLSEVHTLPKVKEPWDISEAQAHALDYLESQVENFVDTVDVNMPDIDWDKVVKCQQVDYTGEMLMKGVPVTWAQVEPGLPPMGMAGGIDACRLAAPGMVQWLRDPSLSIKPRSQWPRRFRRSYVRCKPSELPGLMRGLRTHGIISFLHDNDLVLDSEGNPLANGLFGVPKGDVAAADFDVHSCILRLIISLVPSNELQRIILGEIKALPVFTQWMLLELLAHEVIAFSAEDMRAAFYLFGLPEAWWPYFVLNCPLSEELRKEFKLAPGQRWPCVVLIPMGWVSATGIMQHLHLQMVRLAEARVASADRLPAISRSTMPVANAEMRLSRFLETYLDDYGQGEDMPEHELVNVADLPSDMQLAMREVYQEWGVASSTTKASVRVPKMLMRGAVQLGILGRAQPSSDKIVKGISIVWDIARRPRAPLRLCFSAGGIWVFMLQFKRPVFSLLLDFWEALEDDCDPDTRWGIVVQELFTLVMALPLLHIDYRLPASSVVSCSDASERGAGVVVATGLSADGHEAMLRRLSSLPNLLRHKVILVESCAGIGSGRRGLELLGIVPALYLVSEIDDAAVRVLKRQWPDAVLLGAMEDVTAESVLPHASGVPLAEVLFHFAGTPCRGFCGWNPFASGGQRTESEQLLLEFKRISQVLREVFPQCEVMDCEENVASMDSSTCDWISSRIGRRPVCLDMADLVEQKRRRFFWPSWEVKSRPGVKVENRGHYDNVSLAPLSRLPTSRWIKSGWRTHRRLQAFPTLTRPVPVRTPRWRTPGVDSASAGALRLWRADLHRRPPLHYEATVALYKKGSEKTRFKSVEENEQLHFLERDHTYHCWPTHGGSPILSASWMLGAVCWAMPSSPVMSPSS